MTSGIPEFEPDFDAAIGAEHSLRPTGIEPKPRPNSHLIGRESFDAEEAEEIAYDTVWPTVNELWRGDWLSESVPGMVFAYPRTGIIRGRMMEVQLRAECTTIPVILLHPEGGASMSALGHLQRAVGLLIEEPAPELLGSLIERAKEWEPEEFEDWLELQGLEEEELLTPGKLIAKKCLGFNFETGGDFEKDQFNAIYNNEGDKVWDSTVGFGDAEDEDETDEEPEEAEVGYVAAFYEEPLTQADLVEITAALEVIGAPSRIVQYLMELTRETSDPSIESTK